MKRLKKYNSIYFSRCLHYLSLAILTPALVSSWNAEPLKAQTIDTTQAPTETTQSTPTQPPQDIIRPPAPPLPEIQPPAAPHLPIVPPAPLPPTPTSPEALPSQVPGNITVERFNVVGSTVFSPKILAETVAQYTKKPITFAEVLAAADAITKLYTDKGYINSGAFIPADQTFQMEGGAVKISIVEGSLEDIRVTGTENLDSDYVRSRIAVGTGKPLNVNKLLEALQLLQLNPLIENISVNLETGEHPGTSLLIVKVKEAKTFNVQINLNNDRTPSVGTFERQIRLSDANWLGFGDNLSLAYANTDGSNTYDASYTLPLNPKNGTLQLSYVNANTLVIEPPFDILNIKGNYNEYAATLRQPIIQTPSQEIALGLTFSRRESNLGFLESLTGERVPFPSPGADVEGRTRISAVRFFQDYTQRGSQQVIAARSQFSFGVPVFNATSNSYEPDSNFFAWRGQGQYVRLLAPDTLFVFRADAQLANKALVPLEQIGLGGQDSVRGYRQDLLLADNGLLASAELRYPVFRAPQSNTLLQLAPFFDFGYASNNNGNTALTTSTLASVGLGLRLQQSDQLTIRLDYGIPVTSVQSNNRTLQEKGFTFTVLFNQPF